MDPDDFSSSSPGRVVRTPKGYRGFIPSPLPPTIEWSTSLIYALSEAERNLGRLASLASTLPSPHILVRPFIRREAVLSLRIEGRRASLVDLYHYESAQKSYFDDASDVREVHNYVHALDYSMERSKILPVSLRLIREMHGILLEGVRGDHLTWENWLLFFLKGISSQSQDAISRIKRLGQLREVYRERLRTERAEERLLQTLDLLFERTISNIRKLEAALKVPYKTAQLYVERLEEIGILREVTGRTQSPVPGR